MISQIVQENKVLIIFIIIAFISGIQPLLLKYILNKNIPRKYILFYVTSINLLMYALYFTFINKQTEEKSEEHHHITYMDTFLLFLFYTIVCITLPNLLYIQAVDNDNIISYNSLLYISPMITLIIGYFLLNENVTVKSMIGAALIVMGCIVICTNGDNESKEE
jgi:drug/metabolite transporter (DMT)-like permease